LLVLVLRHTSTSMSRMAGVDHDPVDHDQRLTVARDPCLTCACLRWSALTSRSGYRLACFCGAMLFVVPVLTGQLLSSEKAALALLAWLYLLGPLCGFYAASLPPPSAQDVLQGRAGCSLGLLKTSLVHSSTLVGVSALRLAQRGIEDEWPAVALGMVALWQCWCGRCCCR